MALRWADADALDWPYELFMLELYCGYWRPPFRELIELPQLYACCEPSLSVTQFVDQNGSELFALEMTGEASLVIREWSLPVVPVLPVVPLSMELSLLSLSAFDCDGLDLAMLRDSSSRFCILGWVPSLDSMWSLLRPIAQEFSSETQSADVWPLTCWRGVASREDSVEEWLSMRVRLAKYWPQVSSRSVGSGDWTDDSSDDSSDAWDNWEYESWPTDDREVAALTADP